MTRSRSIQDMGMGRYLVRHEPKLVLVAQLEKVDICGIYRLVVIGEIRGHLDRARSRRGQRLLQKRWGCQMRYDGSVDSQETGQRWGEVVVDSSEMKIDAGWAAEGQQIRKSHVGATEEEEKSARQVACSSGQGKTGGDGSRWCALVRTYMVGVDEECCGRSTKLGLSGEEAPDLNFRAACYDGSNSMGRQKRRKVYEYTNGDAGNNGAICRRRFGGWRGRDDVWKRRRALGKTGN